MDQDASDAFDGPFEPRTPEAFMERGMEAFHVWWDELAPPGPNGGPELDYENARAVWEATYEHNATGIAIMYDGAESNADAAHVTGEMVLVAVVHRHHNGSVVLSRHEFLAWVAEHENHIHQTYFESEGGDGEDLLTILIDHSMQSPTEFDPIRRSMSTASLRAYAEREFAKWWNGLTPAGTIAGRCLERHEALAVWQEAFARLWEELEIVYDNAKAHADVIAETARLELGYIVDRFHNGRLSLAINVVLEYWDDTRYVLQRRRTENAITLRVLCSREDGGT